MGTEDALRKVDALPRLAGFPRQDRVPHPWPVGSSKAYGGRITKDQALAAEVEDVPLAELTGVQRGVDRRKLRTYVKAGGDAPEGKASDSGYPRDLPIVVRCRGKLYVHDGHHRLTAHALLGDRTARARVVSAERPPLGRWAESD